MKINELSIDTILNYCNAYEEDAELLLVFKDAGISYIKVYTGLDDEKINQYDDLSIALLVLINAMYETRSIECDKNKCNLMLDNILGAHSMNLI